MTLRALTLATSAALLSLAGCATQQAGGDPAEASNQRLSSLESRLQAETRANQGLIGELGKKVETLSGELRRVQATAAGQAGGAAAQQALAARLGKTEQRLERLGAQFDARLMEQTLAQQAETEALAERLEAAENQLDEMEEQVGEALAQTEAVQAALPALNEKTDSAGQRIAKSEQRLSELAAQARDALAQATGVQTALPALREKAAEAGPRLNDYAARLAALDKRLEEVARMAQDAFDATGLGQRKIFGKVVESITLTEDKTLFPINSPVLGEQDKAKLDALALRLKALGTNYHLQIQGHTDGFGADDYNYELGKARAEAVKNYLNEKGGIPLLRMSVMSYGSLESTSYAAKNNRRIVVQVLQ